MKKHMVALMGGIMLILPVSRAHASDVGFSLGINLGNVLASVYDTPSVALREPPEFVARPGLGFYFAVGAPYDLFYAADRYYLCRGSRWYAAPNYDGPWVHVGYTALPWGLRRYPISRLRYLREDAGSQYGQEDGYRYFRPQPRGYGPGHCGMRHAGRGMRWNRDDY